MRKKLFLLSCIFLLFCAFSPAVAFGAASSAISVYVGGQKLTFSSPPYAAHYTTLVPMRGIFEKLGATLTYDSKTQTVKAVKGSTVVQLVVGQPVAFVNGDAVKLTAPAVQKSGVTFVPLRFVSQALACTVAYDPAKQRIDITPTDTASTASSGSSSDSAVAPPSPSASSASNMSIEEVGKLADRVVYIETYDAGNNVIASGSGVVTGANGEILTNAHVIEGAASAKVVFNDGSSVTTSTVALIDKTRDLALLQVSKTDLPQVAIGDSGKLVLGQEVVAIGSPLGLSGTLTVGYISATTRQVDGETFIQTSTPIDHGSSGGALFNLHGELVGITSAFIESSANLGLAIPSNDVSAFLAEPRSSIPMASANPQTVGASTGTSGSISVSPSDVQQYLIDEYSSLTYDNGNALDLDWRVTVSSSGDSYIIGGFIGDYSQYQQWNSLSQQDDSVYPGLIAYVSKGLKDHFGIRNVYFGLTLITNFSSYPSGFPSEDVTMDSGSYWVSYTIGVGAVDYDDNAVYYTSDPERNSDVQKFPLN